VNDVVETGSQTRFSLQGVGSSPAGAGPYGFQRGVQLGREAAGTAFRKIGAWSEEHPGQMVLAALALGFVLGKLLAGRPRPVSEELE
jgi:hypothetical protein